MAKTWAAAAGFILLCAPPVLANPPVEAFARLPAIRDARLSPDGKQIAYIQPLDGKPAVVITALGSGDDKRKVIPSTDWTVTALQWVKNDHVMVMIRQAEKIRQSRFSTEYFRNISVPIGDGKMVMMLFRRRAFPFLGSTTPIVDIDLEDPDSIYMPSVDIDDSWTIHQALLKANVQTGGAAALPAAGPANTEGWLMDGHGNIVVRMERSFDRKSSTLYAHQGDDWKQIWTHGDENDDEERIPDLEGLSEDGNSVIVTARDSGAPSGLLKIDMKGGGAVPLLEKPLQGAASLHDPWTGRAVGLASTDDQTHARYFDPQMQALELGLEKNFPGKAVSIASWDQAKDKLLVNISGSATIPATYFIDRTTHQATRLASSYPELKDTDLGETKAYPYRARDGLQIHAYLTLPPGKPAHNLPVVIMPHGGPEARDEIGFDWWVQFLANRGYAVLQPNYRGSTGYGRKFIEAGFHEWGGKMQDDVSDGVHQLVKDGIADPKRVCIVGASYGGYAALAGATLTPDLYACVISYAGLSDLNKLVSDAREMYGQKSFTFKYLKERVGDPVKDADRLAKISPVNLAAAVKAPVLLMHGLNDSTVPVEHSLIMNEALLKAGKTVRLVTFKSEDHYMIQADTRARILQETEAFLYKAIGN